MTGAIEAAGFIIWALAVAGFDWRQRRIPNWLLLIAFVPIAGQYLFFKADVLETGWSAALLGAVVGMVFFLPGYWMGQVGAGDVKFAAMIGLILGATTTLWTMLIAGLLLGLMSAVAKWGLGSRPIHRRMPAGVPIAFAFITVLVVRVVGLRGMP